MKANMQENSANKKLWDYQSIQDVYHLPMLDLVFEAAQTHRKYFDPKKIQISSLISIKTGGCPEDCSYCPQSARYQTDIVKHGLMDRQQVITLAQSAKEAGASRVCLGAAWREVKDGEEFDRVVSMVKDIANMGMEVCCTLGMLKKAQAKKLKKAGLYAYNHNIDSGRDIYKKIITTRKYSDRLQTIDNVRKAKISVCSGGIIGLGENSNDRIEMLETLANLNPSPESVPINTLVKVKGTPLANEQTKEQEVSFWDLLRTIATARIIMPTSMIRLSAGRLERSATEQAMCFLAGANSIFAGDKLLTTPNPGPHQDSQLLDILGITPLTAYETADINKSTNLIST